MALTLLPGLPVQEILNKYRQTGCEITSGAGLRPMRKGGWVAGFKIVLMTNNKI
jgi:hypothetical protein